MPDLRVATLAQDFDALLAHLAANAASFGGDRDRIAVYAGSGNVFAACRCSWIRGGRRSRRRSSTTAAPM